MLVDNCGCLILPFHYENLLSVIKAKPPPLVHPAPSSNSDTDVGIVRRETSGTCSCSHLPTKCPDSAVRETREMRPADRADSSAQPSLLAPLPALSEQLVRLFVGEVEEEDKQ